MFASFDSNQNILEIIEGRTNSDDVGMYQIYITLTDEDGYQAEPVILTLEIVEPEDEAQSDEIDSEIVAADFYASLLLEAAIRRE